MLEIRLFFRLLRSFYGFLKVQINVSSVQIAMQVLDSLAYGQAGEINPRRFYH